MRQHAADEAIKDVLRGVLMIFLLSLINLLGAFGLPLTDIQIDALKGFLDAALVLAFLVFRLLKLYHDSRPAQVQIVDAQGDDVQVVVAEEVPVVEATTTKKPVRRSRPK